MRMGATVTSFMKGLVVSVVLLCSGVASAGVVCQGQGWSEQGDVGWKPSTKQVKDIISKAKDRKIPSTFSCCNKVGNEGCICQDYEEDANGNVKEVGAEHNRTPPGDQK